LDFTRDGLDWELRAPAAAALVTPPMEISRKDEAAG
jgi:hypothetical protein